MYIYIYIYMYIYVCVCLSFYWLCYNKQSWTWPMTAGSFAFQFALKHLAVALPFDK